MKMADARARRDEILRRREAGESYRAIAAAMGVGSWQRVQQIVASKKSVRNIYTPESTRLSRKSVQQCHSYLTDTPREVFVRVADHGWAIGFVRHAGVVSVGRFTSSVAFDYFMDQAEYVAQEMAKQFQRRAA